MKVVWVTSRPASETRIVSVSVSSNGSHPRLVRGEESLDRLNAANLRRIEILH